MAKRDGLMILFLIAVFGMILAIVENASSVLVNLFIAIVVLILVALALNFIE